MTTLILKSSETRGDGKGTFKTYINPLKNNTPDGEPRRSEIYFDLTGSIELMITTYKNGHAILGGEEIETTECPADITLQD